MYIMSFEVLDTVLGIFFCRFIGRAKDISSKKPGKRKIPLGMYIYVCICNI